MTPFYNRRTRTRQPMTDAEIKRRLEAGECVPVATLDTPPADVAALLRRLRPGNFFIVVLHDQHCQHIVTGDCSPGCQPEFGLEAMTEASMRQHAEHEAEVRRALS